MISSIEDSGIADFVVGGVARGLSSDIAATGKEQGRR
jgi:hypothetical protein